MKHHCNKCGKCCKKEEIGPIIFPSDIKDICSILHISHDDFLDSFCEKKLIDVGENKYTIYVLKKKNTGCIFLNEWNLCDIYEKRPYQCRMVPFRFLANYKYWMHLECVTANSFQGLDTRENDVKKFKEIIRGYEGGE